MDCGAVIKEGEAVEGRVSHGVCETCLTRRDLDNPIRYTFFFDDYCSGGQNEATWEEVVCALRDKYPLAIYPNLRLTKWSQVKPGLKLAAWYNGAMRVGTIYIQGKYAGGD